jgi:hypothetical protein
MRSNTDGERRPGQGNADQAPDRHAECIDLDMKQQTLAVSAHQNTQYEQYRKPTSCDAFLAAMEQIVPWAALCEVIEPHYPKALAGDLTKAMLEEINAHLNLTQGIRAKLSRSEPAVHQRRLMADGLNRSRGRRSG